MLNQAAVDVVAVSALDHLAPLDSRSRRRIALVALAAVALLALPAVALDGIDLSEPAEPVAEGECPRLVEIKYPFLRCANGQIGQADADELWESTRRIPMMSRWTESDGAWGPSLNVD